MSEGTTETTEQQTAPPPDATALAAELATTKAQLAEFATWKATTEAANEAAKRERMTESEKLAADRASLDAQRKALKDRSRGDALAKLGVLEKAYQWAPDVDPADPAGAKALEDWAKANPELVKAPTVQSHGYNPPPESALAKVLSGTSKNPILSASWARKLLGGN